MIKIQNKYSYREEDIVGQGAYSTVYQGLNDKTQEIVAIKVIDWERVNDKYYADGFQREVRIMQNLNHPNIAKFYDLITLPNKEYLIMEFCDSQNLNNFVSESGGLLNENVTKIVLQQLLTAYRELMEKGYLHRDLKLENILIHQRTLKLADFGFAVQADYTGNQLLKESVGTPLYMAPQLLENKYYSVKSDIWSIGVLAYRLITGQFPYNGNNTKELLRSIKTQKLLFNINISDDLKDFINNCLQYSELDRMNWEDLFEHKIFKNKYIIQKEQVKKDHLQIALNQIRQMQKYRKTPIQVLFSNLDIDGDNKLTFEEFQSLLLFVNNFMDINVQRAIFCQYNTSRNNLLNFDEFSKIFLQ